MGRKLGQHFLKDKRVLRKIVEALEIKDGDVIVEIGPGHGELTLEIIRQRTLSSQRENQRMEKEEQLVKIIAIEKDQDLAERLKLKIQNLGLKNIQIIEGDALKVLPLLTKNWLSKSGIKNQYKLVGNIPYYITGYLLRLLGELQRKPELIVLTLQKEVAQRLCAKPPKMNLLAASVQFWATPSLEAVINKKAFNPPPEVNSAIIKLVPKTVNKKAVKRYYELIKIVFKQPRKTVLNNLSADIELTKEDVARELGKHGVDPTARPQDLSISDLISLSNVFRARK
jgi:16S rRNA (adenine1518-N6/adenine1519-N6)-dimethyltransferase